MFSTSELTLLLISFEEKKKDKINLKQKYNLKENAS